MKLTLMTGVSDCDVNASVHNLHTMASVYIAPLGVPVLPEV